MLFPNACLIVRPASGKGAGFTVQGADRHDFAGVARQPGMIAKFMQTDWNRRE